MHRSVFTWMYLHGSVYTCSWDHCLWEHFCALLSFTAHALANFEHFNFMCFQLQERSPCTRADLAVFLYRRRWQWLQHFLGKKTKTQTTHNKASDRWDTASALRAVLGSQFHKVRECIFYPSRSKPMLNASFKALDVPSALMKHTLAQPQLTGLRILLWCSCGTGIVLGKKMW